MSARSTLSVVAIAAVAAYAPGPAAAQAPSVKVQAERAGAKRIFQRINQEYASKIYTPDVIETSDAVHFVEFKRNGWLQPDVPSDVAKHFMFTREAQQSNSDIGGLRSFHKEVKEKAGRVPLSQLKLLNSDAAPLEGQVGTIKKKYEEYFGT
jgi:iron(III) transport system substrate-binding protein